MMHPTEKGQTALEYLLIVLIALVVVMTVVVWMLGATEQTLETGSGTRDMLRCRSTACVGDSDCTIPVCGGAGASSDTAAGTCEPA